MLLFVSDPHSFTFLVEAFFIQLGKFPTCEIWVDLDTTNSLEVGAAVVHMRIFTMTRLGHALVQVGDP